MNPHFSTLMIFLLYSGLLSAQPFETAGASIETGGVLTGQVYDLDTKSPLSDVAVYLDSLRIGATSGSDGKFVISLIPEGSYQLIAERLGYKTYHETVRVTRGKLLRRRIALTATEIEGQEVLVTAARKEQTAQMAPASVAILQAKELEIRPVTTFDQALESVPGISVYRSAGTSVQSLSIRGSSDVAGGGVGNRVLLMIDGRPALTSDAGGAYWSLVPINFIERVEVVKGAFSSLYGSSAMGGVVNVITRKPLYRSLTTLSAKYGFFEKAPEAIRYTEDIPVQNELELSHSGVQGRLSYLVNLSRKASDGHVQQSAYEFYDIFSKLLYNFKYNRNLELTLGGGLAENDYPHTWLNSAQPLQVREKFQDDRQEKRQFNMDLHYWAVPNTNVKYSSRFYYYRNAARSYFNENDPDLLLPGNEPLGTTTRIDGDKFGNISQLDLFLSEKNYLIAGVDVQIDKVVSDPDTVLYGDHQVNNFAFYLQDEIQFSSRLTATLGARFDYNHLVGGKTLSQLSPKISLVYHPQERLSLRALFGQAFRAPTIAERFFQVELGGGTLFKPNPDLEAERMDISLETGARWQVNDQLDLDLALYSYHYEDMIYWVDITAEEQVSYPYFQVRNLNSALLRGAEISANWHWKNFHTTLSYNYLNAKDQSPDRSDDILAYRPAHSFYFSNNFIWKRLSLNANGRYRSEVEEVFLYPLQAPQAFFVMNSKATIKLLDNLNISIALNNVFNTEYEELARYRMPGRNWIFGSQFTF